MIFSKSFKYTFFKFNDMIISSVLIQEFLFFRKKLFLIKKVYTCFQLLNLNIF